MIKNQEFRSKPMKGARVEDLYFFVEELKKKAKSQKELEKIQQFIEFKFDYEPITKEMAK